MRRLLRYWLCLIVLLGLLAHSGRGVAADPPTYCLSFKGLKIFRGERLAKFNLHIISGVVVSLPHVPLDWRIVVENDANWMPVVSGIAIHGAADLAPSAFTVDFLRVAGIPMDLVQSGMPGAMNLTGYLEFSQGDAQRVVSLSTKNFSLTPARRCGR